MLTSQQKILTYKTLGLIAMTSGGGERKVKWAMTLLEEGVESETIAILATLQKFINEFEADDYFNRVLKELTIVKPSAEEALRGYVKVISLEVINGDIKPLEGAAYLDRVNSVLEYPEYLNGFIALADDWYSEHIDGLSFKQREKKIIDLCHETYKNIQYPEIFSD